MPRSCLIQATFRCIDSRQANKRKFAHPVLMKELQDIWLMKIHYHTEDVCLACRPFVSMGAYDGLHMGHQAILEQMKFHARRAGAQTMVVIFSPHPRRVLEPSKAFNLNLLTTLEEKKSRFALSGIDHLVILPFTQALSTLNYERFVKEYLWKPLHMQAYFAGEDHGFGRGRAGGMEALSELGSELGFTVTKVAPVFHQGEIISSTRIRKALESGMIRQAEGMLGYPYALQGRVVMGNRIGHTIGYPTANIKPEDPDKMIPGQGVYAVRVYLEDQVLKGMMNIGIRPTINLKDVTIEINLFDFNRDIYGASLRVEWVDRIRDEQRFSSIRELTAQLEQDKALALAILDK